MLNRYQKLIPRQLYQGALVIQTGRDRLYLDRVTPEKIHALAKTHGDRRVLNGTLNGYSIETIFGRTTAVTIKDLDARLDRWLQTDDAIPSLWVVGGNYPSDRTVPAFALQQSSNHLVYIWGYTPWTDMPVYEIQDDTLRRIKCGAIHAPESVRITPELDAKLRESLAARPILF